MVYAVETLFGGTILLLSLKKIHRGVQAILRFCLSNLDGCNVGIIDGLGI
jgi:hypothetical protein